MSLITSLSACRSSSWQLKVATALLVFCFFAGSSTAFAASITGAMNLGNDYAHNGGANLGSATILDFLSAPLPDPGARDAIAGLGTPASTGDLVTVTGSSVGDIVDSLDFAGFSAPISNFLTIEGFQLDLTSLSIVGQSPAFLFLSGSGTLSGNGFDPTAATWSLSAQTNPADGAPTTYSMTIAAVPVPAAVWLFGSGLLGLVGVARRRNNSKK